MVTKKCHMKFLETNPKHHKLRIKKRHVQQLKIPILLEGETSYPGWILSTQTHTRSPPYPPPHTPGWRSPTGGINGQAMASGLKRSGVWISKSWRLHLLIMPTLGGTWIKGDVPMTPAPFTCLLGLVKGGNLGSIQFLKKLLRYREDECWMIWCLMLKMLDDAL